MRRGGSRGEAGRGQGGIEKVARATRLEIVAQVADAVGAAHSVGILHKDVKPANILVVDRPGEAIPEIRMIDFGIGVVTNKDLLIAKGITAMGMTQFGHGDSYSSNS